MSLRARIIVALMVVVVVFGVVASLVVRGQRAFLIDRLDQSLAAAYPLVPSDASILVESPTTVLPPSPTPVEPVEILEFFVLVLDADDNVVYSEGGLDLGDDPDITQIDPLDDEPTRFVSVDGVDTTTRFRTFVYTDPTGAKVLIAAPLTDIESAIDRLRWSLVIAGGAIVAILCVAFTWVARLGLRPIGRVTATATAIAGGARGMRVEQFDARTEAGQLAAAFNHMVEQREAAEQRLRRFVADASHELRTPLTSINGYLDLVADGTFDEHRLADAVRRMRAEAQRMCDLVEDLLLLAHLDEGRPMRREPVDVAAVLADVASDAAVTHPSRPMAMVIDGIVFEHAATTADAPAPRPPGIFVSGDDFRLRQVVGSIVNNALVHTSEGTTISLQAASQADGAVTVSIIDDGPGFDDEAASTAFDRFSRRDTSRSRRASTGGFGLGLAIAQAIVEAHGATISLTTAPGLGCDFTITFPSGDRA